MIETHAHVYDEAFATDRQEMLQHAKNVGITEIWMPNCNSATLPIMNELASQYPEYCLPMVGLHPCYVKHDFETELEIVEAEIIRNKPLAIGEIGLDLFWDKTFFEQQKVAFIFQAKLALKHHLWIDIHSRSAFEQTANLIEYISDVNLKGIFHCFVGSVDEAKKAIELGFLLGIGGVSTFKNSGLDKVLPEIGLENIVLETDSPYLAPVPYRGKRNEPSYIPLIVEKLSTIYNVTSEKVIVETTKNALNLKNEFL
jgi:TatD DNase family protein